MRSIFNISNALTIARIILLIPILYLLSLETQHNNYQAVVIIVVAVMTDYLDGYIARKANTVTQFGRYLDPVADKICVVATVVYLAFFRRNMAQWFALLLVFKDVLILAGAAYMVFVKKVIVQSDMPGKWAVFFVAVTIMLYILNFTVLGKIFMYVSLVWVLHSTVLYIVKFKRTL